MFKFSDKINEGDILFVTDIHGCCNQFSQFLDWVKDSGATVVLGGDLIDRGPNDLGVLERTRDLMLDPESWGLQSFAVIRGNHEQIFLNALNGYGMIDWIRNGGDYENIEALKPHAEWIRELPYFVVIGDTLFSHTGGYHGVNPAEFLNSVTNREEFVWSRDACRRGSGLAKWSKTLRKSVFGHTPKGPLPYSVGDSICVDTGCYSTGVLTAYNATADTIMQFECEGV